MVWNGFVDFWGPKWTFSYDFEGPAIQWCNFCNFMIFICIWLCFCNPNSKSMAWRKQPEPMNSDPCLLLSADWHLAKCSWAMATDSWTMNPELWALAMVQEPLALTKMMQSCKNRISSCKNSEFRIQKPHHHCNIEGTFLQTNQHWDFISKKIWHSLAHSKVFL